MRNAAIDPAALAAELIRRPSVTPKDEGALSIVAGYLEDLGFTCHRLVFGGDGSDAIVNLYARLGEGRPNLCFAGHTDVVPPGAREAWSFDPFSASLRDGALWGRGAVDMKGAIAAFIAAVERWLAERSSGFAGSISLLITGDEEGAGVDGTKRVLEWLAARGEALDACLVGEPTSATALGDMIKIGRRGSLTGRLTVHGVQGHTAYPHLADNAAHRLVAMLHALTSAELDRGSEHFQPSTLQVSTIDIGNPATNVIPAVARAVFNIRFNDRWTGETLKHWIAERLDAVGGHYSNSRSRSAASCSWFGPASSAIRSPRRSAASPAGCPSSAPPAALRMHASSMLIARSPNSALSARPCTRPMSGSISPISSP